MIKEDWEKALSAWENVKKQAEIDSEQAEVYINSIKLKLETFK
jgi:hypothetical protein